MKKEYVHSENLESLRTKIYKYIEIWYNNSRIHSKIGFTSPNEYEESIKEKNENRRNHRIQRIKNFGNQKG